MLKTCSRCRVDKEAKEYHSNRSKKDGLADYCKVCIKEYKKPRRRNDELKSTYGITEDDYNAMVSEQEGACKICSKKFCRLYVDHDHKTGNVRGLLCHSCNVGLGHFFDNISTLTNAIKYLNDTGDLRTSS